MTFIDQIKKATGYDKLENWLYTKPVFTPNPNIQYNSNRTYPSSGLMRYKEEHAQSPQSESRAITPNTDTRAMDPMLAVAAGINTAGSIYTNIQNASAQRAINNDNMMMQKQAQEYNKAMVDYANVYNTPYNQYQRQLDAGINPYAALGAIQGYSGEIAQSPSAPNLTAPQIQNPVGQLGSFLSLNLNKELTERKLDIEQYKSQTDRMLAEKEMNYKEKLASLVDEQKTTVAKSREVMDANIDNLKAQKDNTISKTTYQNMYNTLFDEFGKKQFQTTLDLMLSEIDYNKKAGRALIEQLAIAWNRNNIAFMDAITNNINANTGWYQALTTERYYTKMMEDIDSQIDYRVKQGDLSEAEAELIREKSRWYAQEAAARIAKDLSGTYGDPLDIAPHVETPEPKGGFDPKTHKWKWNTGKPASLPKKTFRSLPRNIKL